MAIRDVVREVASLAAPAVTPEDRATIRAIVHRSDLRDLVKEVASLADHLSLTVGHHDRVAHDRYQEAARLLRRVADWVRV